MFCKECHTELRVLKSKIVLENDNTPDEETKVYREHIMACGNPRCNLKGTEQASVRNEIQIG